MDNKIAAAARYNVSSISVGEFKDDNAEGIVISELIAECAQ